MRTFRYGLIAFASATVGFLVFVAAIAATMTISNAMRTASASTVATVGAAAPDFAAKNLDRRIVHLSDFKVAPVVLVFWADWCPDCKAAIPQFNKLHQQGLKVLAVNLLEDRERVMKAVESERIYYPVALDMHGDIGRLYGVNAIPNVFFIDKNGVIVKHGFDAPQD